MNVDGPEFDHLTDNEFADIPSPSESPIAITLEIKRRETEKSKMLTWLEWVEQGRALKDLAEVVTTYPGGTKRNIKNIRHGVTYFVEFRDNELILDGVAGHPHSPYSRIPYDSIIGLIPRGTE